MMNPGDKLGPYEIPKPHRQGREVYKARDDRLRREVAIKVSNAEFTERFARGARAIRRRSSTPTSRISMMSARTTSSWT
jgi:hypothetical protein